MELFPNVFPNHSLRTPASPDPVTPFIMSPSLQGEMFEFKTIKTSELEVGGKLERPEGLAHSSGSVLSSFPGLPSPICNSHFTSSPLWLCHGEASRSWKDSLGKLSFLLYFWLQLLTTTTTGVAAALVCEWITYPAEPKLMLKNYLQTRSLSCPPLWPSTCKDLHAKNNRNFNLSGQIFCLWSFALPSSRNFRSSLRKRKKGLRPKDEGLMRFISSSHNAHPTSPCLNPRAGW